MVLTRTGSLGSLLKKENEQREPEDYWLGLNTPRTFRVLHSSSPRLLSSGTVSPERRSYGCHPERKDTRVPLCRGNVQNVSYRAAEAYAWLSPRTLPVHIWMWRTGGGAARPVFRTPNLAIGIVALVGANERLRSPSREPSSYHHPGDVRSVLHLNPASLAAVLGPTE